MYDLCYYWLHRLGHEINVLWAAHVVHHQSEEYNLSTALRQTSSGSFLGWIFYLPMAVLGYPPEVFIMVGLIDLLYQFWVHTEQIGKLGWFDRVFVSPSNHRAHHGVNDRYVDKNYGGILILWDRLFGTFVEEDDADPVVYGTRSPLRSWNPVWANLEVYKAMWFDASRAKSWADKLRVWVAKPGWRPADVAAQFPSKAFDIKRVLFHPELSRMEQVYCLVQFTIVLLVTTHYLSAYKAMSLAESGLDAFWLCFSLYTLGALMERRGQILEGVRVIVTAIALTVSASWFGGVGLPPAAIIAAGLYGAISLVCLRLMLKRVDAPVGLSTS
jgi:hypothetical protein